MSTLVEYEALIAELSAKELVTRDIQRLTDALGCSQPRYTDGEWHFYTPPPPPECHEKLIVDTLRKCVHWYVRKDFPDKESGLAILEGLSKEGRWRACVGNTADAYDFAVLLVQVVSLFTSKASTQYGIASKRTAVPIVRAVFDTWLPGTRFRKDGLPVPYLIMLSLFGDAWCAMVLDGHNVPSNKALFDLLQQIPPEFRPGLLPLQRGVCPAELPALEE